jgi:hypothetical protein
MICPLCQDEKSDIFEKIGEKNYYQCQHCSLVFLSRSELISPIEEKERYESHHNSEEDSHYIKYLTTTVEKISSIVPKGASGLDFGCGKSLLMEKLLNQQEVFVSSYDLFFHPNEEVFQKKYDFILLSEVIEHLRAPNKELQRLTGLLKANGYLFIKTKLLTSDIGDFKNWYYRRDKTHIQFFREETFLKMSELFHLQKIRDLKDDLFLFRNNG